MKKGDKVYRVIADLDGRDSLVVLERTLKVVSTKQLRLDSYFPFRARLTFKPDALGREFFASAREAVDAFVRNAERAALDAVKAADRAKERWQEAHEFANLWREQNGAA